MPFALSFRVKYHNTKGLADAPKILGRNLRGGLEGLGKRLRTSAQSRMRRDRGDEEKSLRVEVKSQGANAQLTVYSTLVQAFVDAYGMSRGKFPPFQVGTPLYRWAERRASGIQSKTVKLEGSSERGLSHLSRKPRVAKTTTKAKRTKRPKGVTLNSGQRRRAKNSDAKRIAFLAARTIYEKGIRPTHWNTKALDANKARIMQEIRNALSRSAAEINRG